MRKKLSSRKSNGKESTGLNQPRQQYHYLYGSTDDHDPQLQLPLSQHSPTATDQDSLVGECLVQTDTEHEDDFLTPNNSEKDFQQLLMSNGDGITKINGGRENGRQQHAPNFINWRARDRRFRQSHPILYFSAVAGGVAALLILVTIVIFPNNRIALLMFPIDKSSEFSRHLKIAFPKVDRAEYGDPVQSFLAVDLLDPSFFSRGPTESHEFIFPFPTGAFWTNLVLPPTADRGLSFPIAVYPYAFKWSDTLLQVSYPAQHRVEEKKAIHDYFFPDLTLSASEVTQRRHVVYFDALSVTLRWFYDNGGHMETYLVQGSPYVTVKYDNVSPVLRAFSLFKGIVCPREDEKFQQQMMATDDLRKSRRRNLHRRLSFGICESIPDEAGKSVYLRGVQFVLQTQEGMNWLIFASEPIEFIFDTQLRTTVQSTSSFHGLLRLALMPSGKAASETSNNNMEPFNVSASQIAASTGLQRLIYHAGVYPVRGDVSWSVRPAESLVPGLKSAVKSISGATSDRVVSSPGATTVVGGSSLSDVASSGRIATISFQFATETFSPSSSGTGQKSLLMLALPHHVQSLPSTMQLWGDKFDLQFRCIKGLMRPVLGSTWSYDEPLGPIGFEIMEGRQERQQELLQPSVRSPIIQSLQEDIELALPTLDENVYGFGKQTARLAQLAHIAHELILGLDNLNRTTSSEDGRRQLDSDGDDLRELFDRATDLLRTALEHFLTNNVADYLVFDANLGGIVTINGLRSKDADFGNGRYNDHHFHYGYLLYACAIMGKVDPAFVQSHGSAVDSIYFDVANDSNFASQKAKGVFLPAARHKSWFDGHSFASGLFPFGNGKSQESSSEAVNCYYGALLWSLVRQGAVSDPSLDTSYQTDFARILLATEIRGAQMYWHMHPPVASNKTDPLKMSVYNPEFSENYMVGNLGMMDAVASTWFGTESLYVSMINEIPVTAATAQLFNKPYVQQEYENVLKPLGEVEMAWQGYVVCNHAIVDSKSAWLEAQKLFSPELDSALSKSQVLYWVATRPDFTAPVDLPISASNTQKYVPTSKHPESSEVVGHSDSSSCAEHDSCARVGLTGTCCPTEAGIRLECCNS